MALDDTTQLDPSLRQGADPSAQLPVLTLVHHRDPRHIGARYVFADADRLELGRNSAAFGREALDDPLISRNHAAITGDGSRLRLQDLRSRNGSFVNGESITDRELASGDLVGFGDVLLLHHHGCAELERSDHPLLVGVSAALRHLLGRVALVARQPVTVLLQGETGTGKELVARAIHDASGRPGEFVAINCGAVAEGVLHSELFGHAKGAFSGATDPRLGLVAAATAGTLLLDEIGDASPELQSSLLRLLEQREYRAVGSDRLLTSDARFIAASHVDLAEAVRSGTFREDLYGRLARWVIELPPLRERKEDVALLARRFADRLGASDKPIARDLAIALLRYHWPRNVRELEAVVEQAVVENRGESIAMTTALATRLSARANSTAVRESGEVSHASDASVEGRPTRPALEARLIEHRGNVTALATEMSVARTTVYRWLRQYGIDLAALRYP